MRYALTFFCKILPAFALLTLASLSARAAELAASDDEANAYFGGSVSLSGQASLAGAYGATIDDKSEQGAAYLYLGLDTASGTVTQNVKLTASDGAAYDNFGGSVSLSGQTGLVGASNAQIDVVGTHGAAYFYSGLDTASGTITQNVKLLASEGTANARFGVSVSLSGQTGLVGASNAKIGINNINQGAAYLYRGLDTASSSIMWQDVKLTASDGASGDNFGYSVSLSGQTGLVGAYRAKISINSGQGAAYLYRGLDTGFGTKTQDVKLTASDGAPNAYFGYSVSLSGQTGLVGAYRAQIGSNTLQGAAYLYRGLDTASGTVTQNVKLTASDGASGDNFGVSVSLSGQTGLVGARGNNGSWGAAYLYRGLDTASGTVTQNVKLTASDGEAYDYFGNSVSLDGDNFVIGAPGDIAYFGRAYTGSVSSVTTLDSGGVSRLISGLSFVSQDNWVIGDTTDANTVTLSGGDSATVTAAGKFVSIGKGAGSDDNVLTINGNLVATTVAIGSTAGNVGNTLQFGNTATFTVGNILLSEGNILSIQGDYTDTASLLNYLGATFLQVWEQNWITITSGNASSLISSDFSDGYTTIQAVPEPGTWVLLASGGIAALLFLRRQKVASL